MMALETLQTAIEPDTGLLEWVSDGTDFYAFLLARRGLVGAPMACGGGEVTDLGRHWERWLAMANTPCTFRSGDPRLSLNDAVEVGREKSKGLFGLLRRAGEVLFPPIFTVLLAEHGIRRLVVIPEKPVRNLPFHAVFLPQREAWLEEFLPGGVWAAPSAAVYAECRGRQRGVAQERKRPRISRVLAGQVGREAFFATAPLRGAWHVMGEGEWMHEYPGKSSLRLADGPLRAEELDGYRDALRRPSLIIWDVAGSARISASSGGELGGFVPSLLAGGARSVIAPLWLSPPDTRSRFWRVFFTLWSSGKVDVARALAATRRGFRSDRSGPTRHRQPFFWAGNVLTGGDIF